MSCEAALSVTIIAYSECTCSSFLNEYEWNCVGFNVNMKGAKTVPWWEPVVQWQWQVLTALQVSRLNR